MPVIKELQDVVDLLGQYDEGHQRRAVKSLLDVANSAEQDIADSHLSREERRAASKERFELQMLRHRDNALKRCERWSGKAAADAMRAQFDAEDERQRQTMRQFRRDLSLD